MKILPSTGPERRWQLLFLVLLIATGAVTYWMQRSAATPAGTVAADAAAGRPQEAGPLPVPDVVRLASLDDVAVLSDAGRNPFAFGVRPLPPPPQVAPVAPPTMPSVPLPPSPPPGPPPIGLKLTGLSVLTPGGRTMVTLQDPISKAVYNAFEGDVVDGRYKVVKVGLQSVVVSYVDGTGVRTLALGG